MSPRVVASMFDVLYRQKEFLLVHRFLIRITFLFRASDILKYLTTFRWFPTPLTNCSGQTGIKNIYGVQARGPVEAWTARGPGPWPVPPPPKTATASRGMDGVHRSQGVWMGSFDLKGVYYSVRVNPHFQQYFTCYWKG